MKIISRRELTRAVKMLESGDNEMQRLGRMILLKGGFRFSLHTIITFHALLFLISITVIEGWLWDLYPKIHTTMWMAALMQLIWSIYHCITIAKFRKRYNELLQSDAVPPV